MSAVPIEHVFAHTPETMRAWCESRGMPGFRAKQILEWVYARGVIDPGAMTNLSARDRETLTREMAFLTGDVVRHQSATDGTEKLLIAWEESIRPAARRREAAKEGRGEKRNAEDAEKQAIAQRRNDAKKTEEVVGSDSNAGDDASRHDGEGAGHHGDEHANERRTVALPLLSSASSSRLGAFVQEAQLDTRKMTECVMIPTEDRRTACISSQVGCPVGCKFCASGIGGLESNLTAGRIVEQVWRLRDMLRAGAPGELPRITNVVFMGMGEPLANFGPVMHALRTICAPWGHGISARKVTISTVGLPSAIEKLARECELPVTLALSLHAPTDDIRRELIPWAQYSTIRQLLDACQMWFEKTGREITLEYTLLRGINDRPEHARELARLANSLRANVNLIRYNENPGLPYGRPMDDDVRRFQELLREARVNAHIRASRGRDIAAACGQLRHEMKSKALS